MLNKRGFTLIELLTVVVLLALMAIMIIPPVMDSIDKSRTYSHNQMVNNIESVTKLYISNHKDTITDINVIGAEIKISLQDLVSVGLLKAPIIDPKTETTINLDREVSICVVGKNKYLVSYDGIENCGMLVSSTPIVTINGSNPVSIVAGSSYIDAGATARSDIDGNLTGMIITSSNVNTNVLGNYTVTYSITVPGVSTVTAIRTVQVTATDSSCFTFNSSTKTITGYSSSCPKTVVIPSSIGGVPVNIIGPSAFLQCDLTSVIIPNSVTSIGSAAFMENQLTSLIIPNSVTSIGIQAFELNQLTSVTIPNSITSIANYVFWVNQLTSVVIPNSVTSIGAQAFAQNELTSVTIPSSVTTIGSSAFNENQLPDSQAFIYARNSNGTENTSVLIGYGGAKRSGVVIPNNVTSIGNYALSGTWLTSVTIPNTVTSIGTEGFSGNELTSIAIPNSVTSIGNNAFKYNHIPQGSATIDNSSGSVTIGSGVFDYNGSGGNTTITPVYLRTGGGGCSQCI